jgi:hypothetical protein
VGGPGVSYYDCRRELPRKGALGMTGTVCSQCDNPESKCNCDKYCCFCQSQQSVRLCVDGLYYCPDCREACDIHVADRDER